MINIELLLKENKTITDYKINTQKTESYELFFVHKGLETVRSTDTVQTVVTVYVAHDGKLGDSSFRLYASTQEEEAREKIAQAAQKAALLGNEMYALPKDEVESGVIPSNFSEHTLPSLAASIAEAVFAADVYESGSINALEVFVNRHTVSVKNSRGVDKTEVKYTAMLEAIPTWNEGESVELYEAKKFNFFDADDIREEIRQKMEEVRDRGLAQPPKRKLDCPVLLGGHELAELLGELAYELNYARVYTHSNAFSVGTPLQTAPTGDLLTLTMRGQLQGSAASALFDEDGISLTDVTVIADGKAVDYYGSNRFAQYLGKAPTGMLRCMELATGTLSDSELAQAPYFECVSLSGLQVDVCNDYIGGEVRLAYYHDGNRKIPMTGISIAGKLSEVLNSVRLSDTAKQQGSYLGPKAALFRCMEIV